MVRPTVLYYRISALISQLNAEAVDLFKDAQFPIFATEPSITKPQYDSERSSFESSFSQTISWFYILYNEIGRDKLPFLVEKFGLYAAEQEDAAKQHLEIIQNLRTYFQHNLKLDSKEDQKTRQICFDWFKATCGNESPVDSDEWFKCLVTVLDETHRFFGSLNMCLIGIGEDDSSTEIVEQWRYRITRSHSPHQFDNIVNIAAQDMGLNHIDPIAFRKRFYDKWKKQLANYSQDYDFKLEARKLVEATLLTELDAVMPITGQDIIESGIEPGPRVGQYLAKARAIFQEDRSLTREELLVKLEI